MPLPILDPVLSQQQSPRSVLDILSSFPLLDLRVQFCKIGMTESIVTARGYGPGSSLVAQVRFAAPSTAGLRGVEPYSEVSREWENQISID